MSLNKIGNQVSASIQSIFQSGSTSPAGKKEKKSDSASASNQSGQTRPASPGDQPPFTGPQLRWLGNAVSQSNEFTLNLFGGVVEERFTRIEDRVTNTEQSCTSLEKQIDDNNQTSSKLSQQVEDLRIEHNNLSNKVTEQADLIDKLRGEVNVQRSWQPSTASRSAAAAPQATASRGAPSTNTLVYELPVPSTVTTPFGDRKEAVIGNLGWSSDRDTLLANCQTVLAEARVDPSSHHPPTVDRAGSQVSIVFRSAIERKEAQRKVQELKKLFPEVCVAPTSNHERPFVWMGPQKTSDELIGGRILKHLRVAIEDLESRLDASVSDGWNISGGTLYSEWKLCKNGAQQTLVIVTSRQIRWTPFASSRYSELEDLTLISEWSYSRAARRS